MLKMSVLTLKEYSLVDGVLQSDAKCIGVGWNSESSTRCGNEKGATKCSPL
jgi:hypothetical protein